MFPLVQQLEAQARQLGFDLVGIAPATSADGFAHLENWLDQGFAGAMTYMERQRAARRHPASILATVRSVVMVGMLYTPEGAPGELPPRTGRVARYALGKDYHEVLWARLDELLAWVHQHVPDCAGRGVVDTAPLLERDFARRAGLGWFGKNTMLINKHLGSYFFLGALLLSIDLPPSRPHETAHCGSCTACLQACPTQAFVAPGVLDARRCISYLTIELRDHIPEELRPGVGEWVFGCDVCQEVCPWNHRAPAAREPALQPSADWLALDLVEVLGWTEEEFRRRCRGTALRRTKRRGLLRNAALVLGNRGDPAALPALHQALRDPEPLVREAAAWAIAAIRHRLSTNAGDLISNPPEPCPHPPE